ncbi:KTSC domain-containing protein [Cognatilysobacter terrigena]|uniref:KTSC domain-containing protein n=1 Tax=Cognatilysobacter terrigena TaxID=2488749 RepID=UPI00105E7885|nr:KTSC domain-containing protein [Lysobacter terrigena]
MDRISLDSEALSSVGYDPSRRVLEVEFTSGRVYQYFGVPQIEVERLLEAESQGAYFSERVRDRYPFELIH